MGNICQIFNMCEIFTKNTKNDDEIINKPLLTNKSLYNNSDNFNNITFEQSLYTNYLPSYSEIDRYNNINSNFTNIQQTQSIIALNSSPNINPFIKSYYNSDDTLMTTGFFGEMLCEDILHGD